MHDPRLVRLRQAVGNLCCDWQEPLERKRAAGEQLTQRLPLDLLHSDVGDALERTDVVDRDDIRVVQGRRRPRLLLEAPQPLRVGRHLCRQHLDGHLPPEPVVPRPVDFSHPSRAERSENLVGAQARPFPDRRWSRS